MVTTGKHNVLLVASYSYVCSHITIYYVSILVKPYRPPVWEKVGITYLGVMKHFAMTVGHLNWYMYSSLHIFNVLYISSDMKLIPSHPHLKAKSEILITELSPTVGNFIRPLFGETMSSTSKFIFATALHWQLTFITVHAQSSFNMVSLLLHCKSTNIHFVSFISSNLRKKARRWTLVYSITSWLNLKLRS